MPLSSKKCYLNIPLNDKGIKEHETFDLAMKNVLSIEISEEEYSLLSDFFYEINKKFNVLIDIFEEETLENKDIAAAIDLLKEYILKSNESGLLAAETKLMNAFLKAKELNMPIYFDF